MALNDSNRTSHNRPRIGVTTYYEEGSWGTWTTVGAIVPGSYVESVVSAGGTPLLLPPVATDVSVLDVLDGLIVIGGCDVDPQTYRADPHPATSSQPQRDHHDLTLTTEALRRDIPLFAICRGAQILNVALGGTLIQHLPDVNDNAAAHRPGDGLYGTMKYHTTPGSIAHSLVGPQATGPCHHHQALDTLGHGLEVTARAADGTIEAIEYPAATWLLGVQFHPEENHEDPRLFEGFINAARERGQHGRNADH